MSLHNKKGLRIICPVLFILYCIALVYFLIFSDSFGRGQYEVRRYNLEPFMEIKRFINNRNYLSSSSVIMNLLGNVLAFIPFGILIMWIRKKSTGFFTVAFLSALFSFAIEIVQYVTRLGVFDVDDIIMNTFGGVLGYIIYCILARIDRKRRK